MCSTVKKSLYADKEVDNSEHDPKEYFSNYRTRACPSSWTNIPGHVCDKSLGRDKLPRSRLLQILRVGQTSQVTFITNTSGGTDFPGHVYYKYFGWDRLPSLLQILRVGQTSQVTFITNTSGGTNFPDHACYSSGAGNIN